MQPWQQWTLISCHKNILEVIHSKWLAYMMNNTFADSLIVLIPQGFFVFLFLVLHLWAVSIVAVPVCICQIFSLSFFSNLLLSLSSPHIKLYQHHFSSDSLCLRQVHWLSTNSTGALCLNWLPLLSYYSEFYLSWLKERQSVHWKTLCHPFNNISININDVINSSMFVKSKICILIISALRVTLILLKSI